MVNIAFQLCPKNIAHEVHSGDARLLFLAALGAGSDFTSRASGFTRRIMKTYSVKRRERDSIIRSGFVSYRALYANCSPVR